MKYKITLSDGTILEVVKIEYVSDSPAVFSPMPVEADIPTPMPLVSDGASQDIPPASDPAPVIPDAPDPIMAAGPMVPIMPCVEIGRIFTAPS